MPAVSPPDHDSAFDLGTLSSADRTRIICAYITRPTSHGGLGIAPDSAPWSMVKAIVPLHDEEFNTASIPSWLTHPLAGLPLDKIRLQVRDP